MRTESEVYEFISKNWEDVCDALKAQIDCDLENCEYKEAIKHSILLEQAGYAQLGEKYDFEKVFK